MVIGLMLYILYRWFDQLSLINIIIFACVVLGPVLRLVKSDCWELTISKNEIKWSQPGESKKVLFSDVLGIVVSSQERCVVVMGKRDAVYTIPKRCLADFE